LYCWHGFKSRGCLIWGLVRFQQGRNALNAYRQQELTSGFIE
jgi:hypothetical protein